MGQTSISLSQQINGRSVLVVHPVVDQHPTDRINHVVVLTSLVLQEIGSQHGHLESSQRLSEEIGVMRDLRETGR
jgi:hypothetical protein